MTSIRHVTASDLPLWLKMRHALWPEGTEAEHKVEIERFLSGTAREPQAVLVAEDSTGQLVGFAELSIHPYAEGCSSNNVAYLEGWYVAPEFRKRGIARALIEASEQWALEQGCTEFASDTPMGNDVSVAAHEKCGFTEVMTIRCFMKVLNSRSQT